MPLPFAFAQLTETAAWRETFRELGCDAKYGPLLRVRLACEAIVQTLPAGMVVAESLKPALLVSQVRLNASDAVCGTASRKLLLLVTQCVYFALAVIVGLPALLDAAQASRFGFWLPSIVGIAWLVLLVAASGLWFAMQGGNVCQQVLQLLKSIPIRGLRNAAHAWSAGFAKTDARIRELCSLGPARLARAVGLYLLAWCLEAAETLLLLRLLGVQLDWGTLCLIEVCASMIRHIAFVSPAGLGFQDLGYAGLLQVFGVPDWLAVAAAFSLLKRGKELFWSVIGYGMLAAMKGKRAPVLARATG